MPKHLQTLLRVSVFLGFLIILSRMIEIDLLKEAAQQLRADMILLAIVVYLGNIAVRAYRLQVLLNHDEFRLSLKDSYLITLIGVTLNTIIPATMGDIARSYYGYKLFGLKEEMLSTTLVDKLFALCSLFVLGSLSAFAMRFAWLGLFSLGAAMLTFVPLMFPRLVPWHLLNIVLRRFQKSLDHEKLLRAFRLSGGLKLAIMAISLAGWLCTCVFFYIVCSAFPVDVSLGFVLLIMPALTIVRLFPFTVNALGPVEIAVAYFFNMLGIPATLAVLISLTSNIISSVIPGLLGLLVILTSYDKKKVTLKR